MLSHQHCFNSHNKVTYDPVKKKKVTIWLDGHSDEPLINTRLLRKENGTVRALTISDLKLLVRKPRGTMVVKDVNCDSTFMLETICEIGTAVCSKFHYLDPFVPIHLFMDNAGGHGTKAVKEEYTEILKT